MVQQSLNVAYSDGSAQVLWEDGDRPIKRSETATMFESNMMRD
jgi:hypothetical protein